MTTEKEKQKTPLQSVFSGNKTAGLASDEAIPEEDLRSITTEQQVDIRTLHTDLARLTGKVVPRSKTKKPKTTEKQVSPPSTGPRTLRISTGSPKKPRRLFKYVLSGLAVLIILAGGWFFLARWQASSVLQVPDNLANIFPNDTTIYLETTSTALSDLAPILTNINLGQAESAGALTPLSSALDQLSTSEQGEVAIGIIEINGQTELLGIVPGKSKKSILSFLQSKESYQGFRITTAKLDERTLSIVADKENQIFSTSQEALKKSLDQLGSPGASLGDNSLFQQTSMVFDSLLGNTSIYINLGEASVPLLNIISGQSGAQALAVRLSGQGQGLNIDFVAVGAKTNPPLSRGTSLFAYVPNNVISASEAAAINTPFVDEVINTKLPESITGQIIGKPLLVLLPENDQLEFGIIAPIANGEEVRTLMRTHEPAIIAASTDPATSAFLDNDYRDEPIRFLNIPDKSTSVDYLVKDNLLLFASSKDSMYSLVDVLHGSAPSLLTHEQFSEDQSAELQGIIQPQLIAELRLSNPWQSLKPIFLSSLFNDVNLLHYSINSEGSLLTGSLTSK